jgi:hypothetical protein
MHQPFTHVANDRYAVPCLQDMLEWIKLLSQQTRLNKENHFIEQAEDMISKATYLQARFVARMRAGVSCVYVVWHARARRWS